MFECNRFSVVDEMQWKGRTLAFI